MDTPQPPLPEGPIGFQPLVQTPPPPERLGIAIAAGVVMALILGAAWAVLTVVTNTEFGLLAWGIGVAIGYGITMAGQGSGPLLGIVAAVSSLLAILFGKFLIVRHSLEGEKSGAGTIANVLSVMTTHFSAVFSFYDFLWIALALGSAWKFAGIRR